jgi:hypothetical protein
VFPDIVKIDTCINIPGRVAMVISSAETIEGEQMKASDKIIQQWTDGNNVA